MPHAKPQTLRRASRILCLTMLWLVGCATRPPLQHSGIPVMPEGPPGRTGKPGWATTTFAVAAANPLAAEAGAQMLRAGGTALDAAVAAQMVLTLVEPQSSGIGGAAFLLHRDGSALQARDGRETAAAAADERLLLLPSGKPMPVQQALVGGRAVGVPGTVRLLEAAHRQHGRLPWAQVLQRAITLVDSGFPISPRPHIQLLADAALRLDLQTDAYFYQPDGQPHPVGHTLRKPALAAVLRRIASEGSAALYFGTVAVDMRWCLTAATAVC